MPPVRQIAHGSAPGGGHWTLEIGGSPDGPFTIINLEYPDGRRHGGGIGAGVLQQDTVMATYFGRSSETPLSIVCRAKPKVARLRVEGSNLPGESLDLTPVASLPEIGTAGEVFFAAVLPPDARLSSFRALDADGHTLDTTIAAQPPSWN